MIDPLEKNGEFVHDRRPDEKQDLQAQFLKLLNARGCHAREGQELARGETNIILPGDLIVENKVAGKTTDLSSLKPDAAWQARSLSKARANFSTRGQANVVVREIEQTNLPSSLQKLRREEFAVRRKGGRPASRGLSPRPDSDWFLLRALDLSLVCLASDLTYKFESACIRRPERRADRVLPIRRGAPSTAWRSSCRGPCARASRWSQCRGRAA